MQGRRSWGVVLLLGITLAFALPLNTIAQAGTPADAPATPRPLGTNIDIGGRVLFLSCTGAGAPTVVLEAGSGNTAATWAGVQPEIGRFTRVCSYDRAGLGQSDPAPPGVRTVQDSVDDLHALLDAAGISGPYVLAGHSLGGLIVRLYASQHPDDVVGLVLVDGMPSDLPASGLALLPPAERNETFAIMRGLHPQDPEHLDIIASGVWVMAHPPAPVPTVVLAAGFHGAPGAPPDPVFEELWNKLQREQARVLDAHFVPVSEADHFLQQDRPELVIEAIRQVVEAMRDPSTCIPPTPGMAPSDTRAAQVGPRQATPRPQPTPYRSGSRERSNPERRAA
jgi:pimeloyl-ACP methyl ester carboxylesterase